MLNTNDMIGAFMGSEEVIAIAIGSVIVWTSASAIE